MTEPRIYSLAELAGMQPPAAIVDDLLFDNGYSALVGPSGIGKSFIAIALSVSVAGEVPFFGRAVRGGPVVYVAPEGFVTFHHRAAAAIQAAGIGLLDNLYVVRDAVYLHDGKSVAGFCAAITAALKGNPRLIVFDTLAKCSAGMEENSNSDRELTNAGVDYIRKATGAHVMVTHHTGWNEDRERGASALRAAVDTMLHLKQEDAGILLTADKQRDMEDGGTMRLELTPFGDTKIVTTMDASAAPSRLPKPQMQALEVLESIALSDGIACSAWLASSNLTQSSFYRARKALVKDGYVQSLGRGRYVITPAGLGKLPTSNALPHNSHGSAQSLSSTSPAFRLGVEVSRPGSGTVALERGGAWEPEPAERA